MLRPPCVSVGGAGCTLPGGLESVPRLAVVGIGYVACKPLHNSGCTCKVLDISQLDLYEMALSNVDT